MVVYTGDTYVKKVVGNMKSVQRFITGFITLCCANNLKKLCENFVFQQDNFSIHTSTLMKKFFEKEHINTLEWPARNPDFSIIDNL